MVIRKQNVMVAFVLVAAIVAPASTDAWKQFRSPKGFSVMYPGTWFEIGRSPDRLQLLSSAHGAEGIVIKRGQAEVVVLEASELSAKTLAQVIDYYTQRATVLSRRNISERDRGSCGNLQEVVSKEPAVPPKDVPTYVRVPYIINTDLFCEVGGRKIVVLLRNWEGDKRQAQYQWVALRMAKSIRILQ